MKISELFLTIAVVFETAIVIWFPLYICLTSDSNCTAIFWELKEWISELFYNKNLFGKILSCLVIIVFIPGVIMVLILNIYYT